MVELTTTQQEQVKFHLGYSPNVPAHAMAALVKAVTNVSTTTYANKIGTLLTRIESAYDDLAIDGGSLTDTDQTSITGDVVRTTTNQDQPNLQLRLDYYNQLTGDLSLVLGVVNFRDAAYAQNAIAYSGGLSINTLPGTDGTNGSVIHNGSDVPTDGSANESTGDYYIHTGTGNLYHKDTSTTWTLISNLIGPRGQLGPRGMQGINGEQGAQGVAGADGAGLTPTSALKYALMYG